MLLGEHFTTDDLRNIYWIETPSHAWLRLPTYLVETVDYKPTEYSYLSESLEISFLEEDVDGPGFLRAAYGDDQADWPTFPTKWSDKGDNYTPGPRMYPAPSED